MKAERKLEISIKGKTYYLSTDLPPEYITHLAEYINRYIEQYPQYAKLDEGQRAVLSSINIMNDYWQYRIRNLIRTEKIINRIDGYLIHENNKSIEK